MGASENGIPLIGQQEAYDQYQARVVSEMKQKINENLARLDAQCKEANLSPIPGLSIGRTVIIQLKDERGEKLARPAVVTHVYNNKTGLVYLTVFGVPDFGEPGAHGRWARFDWDGEQKPGTWAFQAGNAFLNDE